MKTTIGGLLVTCVLLQGGAQAEIAGSCLHESEVTGASSQSELTRRRAYAWAQYREAVDEYERDCHWMGGNSLLGPLDLIEIDEPTPTYYVSAKWQCCWFRRPIPRTRQP